MQWWFLQIASSSAQSPSFRPHAWFTPHVSTAKPHWKVPQRLAQTVHLPPMHAEPFAHVPQLSTWPQLFVTVPHVSPRSAHVWQTWHLFVMHCAPAVHVPQSTFRPQPSAVGPHCEVPPFAAQTLFECGHGSHASPMPSSSASS